MESELLFFVTISLQNPMDRGNWQVTFHRVAKSWTSLKQFSTSVQFNFSFVSDSATPWTEAPQASLSITNSQNLLKLMPTESVMPFNHLILWRPLLLLPSTFPSLRVFSNESVLLIRWLNYWSFNFSLSPSNDYTGLISFMMDWLDFLAV